VEHVIASYLRQVWDKNYWLYEGQHGFRPGYSCESQVITVCHDIADSLDNGDRIDATIVDFSKAFYLVPHGRLFTKITNSGVDPRVVVWIKGIPFRSRADSQRRRATNRRSLSNVRCAARKRIRSSSVPSLRKRYLEEYGKY
jgi:hypothetical protein